MALGLYGKHPAKGDFLEAGMPAGLQRLLESWLDAVLAEVRETLGPEWQTTWDAAPALHFWLGEGLWGGAVAGVLAPSRDRVGRRFPLVLLAAGPDAPPPPVLGGSQWQGQAAGYLSGLLRRAEVATAAEVLAEAPLPVGQTDEAQGAIFWAVRPGPDVAALWSDLAATDQRHAATGRSYWWVTGEADGQVPDSAAPQALAPRPPLWSQVWAGPGLPSGEVLAWLLRGHIGHD